MRNIKWIAFLATAAVAALAVQNNTMEDLKNIEGFDKLMERGQLPAIFNPDFAAVGEASIPDNAWVIGVSHNGATKAYAINLLNRCEVVNDSLGDEPVLISWSPLAQAVGIFSREVNGKTLEFESSGALFHGAHVLVDTNSDSYWSVVTGKAIGGPMQGAEMKRLPVAVKTLWGDWKTRHADTGIMTLQNTAFIAENPYDAYYRTGKTYKPVVDPDDRLDDKMPVFGFVHNGEAFAISFKGAAGGWEGKAGGDYVFIYRPERSNLYQSSHAYLLKHNGERVNLRERKGVWADKELGEFDPIKGEFINGVTLERLAGTDMFWHVWSKSHEKTDLLNPPRRKRRGSNFENDIMSADSDDPLSRKY